MKFKPKKDLKIKGRPRSSFFKRALTGASTALTICLTYGISYAQVEPPEDPLELLPPSLKDSNFRLDSSGDLVPAIVMELDGTIHGSLSPDLDKFLQKNSDGSLKWKEAVKLGKAMFWDMQIGSDGQACASCHFHVGADNRTRNQLNPGLKQVVPKTTFDTFVPSGGGGADYTLVQEDFPFYKLTNPDDRDSDLIQEIQDVASSQGVFPSSLDNGVDPLVTSVVAITSPTPFGGPVPAKNIVQDTCNDVADPIFHINGQNVRKVEPRNTPTFYNSTFNFDNFWDGRAKWTFNNEVIGRRVESPIFVGEDPGTAMSKDMQEISDDDLHPGSTASQAVGPPRSDFEMSCANRSFDQIGKKMLPLRPLGQQKIHPDDSVLGGSMIHATGKGLAAPFDTYENAIKEVFLKKYWGDTTQDFGGFTQIEKNFITFFGIANMIYESTQVSEVPFDVWREAGSPESGVPGFGVDEIAGAKLFVDKGKCYNCHATALFTKASVLHLGSENEEEGLVERMPMNDGGIALYDNGFYNIGTTPTDWDIGRGGKEADQELSFTEQWIKILLGENVPDPFEVNPCSFEVPFAANGDDFPVAQSLGHFEVITCPGDPLENIDDFDTALPKVPSTLPSGNATDIAAL